MAQGALTVDILVIGWGKAGKTIAGTLGRAGRRVAIVERDDQMYGGTCINIACVPTKALVHEADSRRDDDDPEKWFAAAQQFRNTLTGTLRAKNFAMLDTVDAVTIVNGEARFIDEHSVAVSAGDDALTISAETIVINTGAVPALPELAGVDGPRIHTSTSLQQVDPLPQRLVVVGGGYVGLEFASMFAHFGSTVTVLDRNPRLLRREDEDIADAVHDVLAGSGVTLIQDAEVDEFVSAADGVTVAYRRDGKRTEIEADAVLLSVGRRPATDTLNAAAIGISVGSNGAIEVDEHLRTTLPHVFAVGDVNGGPQYTYVSYDDHRIVLNQLTGDGTRSTLDRKAVPSTIFLTPPLGRVGLTEAQAREANHSVRVAAKRVADIAAMPRPKIVRETHGIIKFVVDAESDLILGATLFCIDAQEIVNLVALAMRAGVTASELRDGIWTHPSTTEAVNEVLAGLS